MRKLFAFILFIPQFLFSQSVAEKLEKYQDSHHLEKVYVNHDKPMYVPGDHIWAKAYVLNGRTHEYFDAKPVLYVDWVSPQNVILQSYSLQIEEGSKAFDIETKASDPPGPYVLRAYTRYQKNFATDYIFQKEIQLIDIDSIDQELDKPKKVNDFQVAFYPESGNLISGLQTKVAFKVQNDLAENIEVKGKLISGDGEVLSLVRSGQNGIGVFELKPQSGEFYEVEFSYGDQKKRFALPKILKEGMSVAVDNLDPDFIRIKLQSSLSKGLSGAELLGHIRGQLFLSQSFDKGNQKELLLPKTELPSGILHFTLFDAQKRPHCERLVFNKNKGEKIEVGLEMQKEDFARREEAEFRVSTLVGEKLEPSQLSVSVFDMSYHQALSEGLNIENYLLLQSDVKGRIENINQYFQKDELKSNILLDQLMMTHAWRRFTWTDVLAESYPEIVYPVEENLSIAGKVFQRNSDKVVKADVFLNVLSEEAFASLNLTTLEDGLFIFKGFEFRDTTNILIQANVFNAKKKEKRLKKGEARRIGNKNVSISLLDFHKLDFEESISLPNQVEQKAAPQIEALKEELVEIQRIDSTFDAIYNITLEDVDIEARRNLWSIRRDELKEAYRNRGMFMLSSTPKVFLDDFPKEGQLYRDLYGVLQSIVPGVRVEKIGSEIEVYMGRSTGLTGEATPALIVVDGSPVNNAIAAQIQASQIKVIDRLQGLQASALWGPQGAGGVIIVTTRAPSEQRNLLAAETKIKGAINIDHPGFYQARQFYAPNYRIKKEGPKEPDLRTTLYWNPDIRIKDEKVAFDFFMGDRTEEFVIWVEGISDKGIPFSAAKKIRVVE